MVVRGCDQPDDESKGKKGGNVKLKSTGGDVNIGGKLQGGKGGSSPGEPGDGGDVKVEAPEGTVSHDDAGDENEEVGGKGGDKTGNKGPGGKGGGVTNVAKKLKGASKKGGEGGKNVRTGEKGADGIVSSVGYSGITADNGSGITRAPDFKLVGETVLVGAATSGRIELARLPADALLAQGDLEIDAGGGIIDLRGIPAGRVVLRSDRGRIRLLGRPLLDPDVSLESISEPDATRITVVAQDLDELVSSPSFWPYLGDRFAHPVQIGPACKSERIESQDADSVVVTGAGRGAGPEGDQLAFAYRPVTGDFSARVTLAASDLDLGPFSSSGMHGILARQDGTPNSRYVMIHDSSTAFGEGVRMNYRATHGGSDDIELNSDGRLLQSATLRLDRAGNTFTGFILAEDVALGDALDRALDGASASWIELGHADWGPAAPETILLGLAVTSDETCGLSTMTFRSWELLPGKPRAALEFFDLGLKDMEFRVKGPRERDCWSFSISAIPGSNPEDVAIPVVLHAGGVKVAETVVEFKGQGIGGEKCCVSPEGCNPVPDGFTASCSGECPGLPGWGMCVYEAQIDSMILPLPGGTIVTAVIDPDGLFVETAPDALANNSVTLEYPYFEGTAFVDLGITGMTFAPASRDVWDVDVDFLVVPSSDTQDATITVALLADGVRVAESATAHPREIGRGCCSSDEECGPGAYCGYKCDDGTGTGTCVRKRKTKLQVSGLRSGAIVTAVIDPEHLHRQTWPALEENDSLSKELPLLEGAVFRDLGVNQVTLEPAGPGLYRVIPELRMVPVAGQSFSAFIEGRILANGEPAGEPFFVAADLTGRRFGECCAPDGNPCDNPPYWICFCNTELICKPESQETPNVCACRNAAPPDTLSLVAAASGMEVTVVFNVDGAHLEIGPEGLSNNSLTVTVPTAGATFVRGDGNSSGTVDLSDAIGVLGHLFTGAPAPACLDAADSDDNGVLEITDAIRVLVWLFAGGAPPARPSPMSSSYAPADCGEDPSADSLGCFLAGVACQ